MKKSTLVMVLCLVLAVAIGVGSTMAYLQDTDEDVNVMTLGSVYITQNEQERDADGNLVPFTQEKPAYPAVGPIEWADKGVLVNGTEYKVFTEELKNVVDKIVTVTNTGKSDAYVRTIIALEAPDYDPNDLIHVNVNGDKEDVTYTSWTPVNIEGVQYVYSVFTYQKALAPQETSVPSLMQLFLDKEAKNEDVEKFGDTWEVLVLSQAVQTQGFANAETALNTAYGETNATNVAEWFGGDFGDNIGTPGDKWPNNNPPLNEAWAAAADTSWYNETDTEFVIDTAEELAGLAELVNAGNTFAGKTIKLGGDIDLAGKTWTPIGSKAKPFKADFDGQNYTISNLTIVEPDWADVALIGYALNSDMTGITLDNVAINGYQTVAGLVGTAYTGCTITDCHVTGNINITAEYAYAGGICAYGYVDIDNCSVIPDGTGYITAKERNAVGGICAWVLENNNNVTNCHVENLELTGWANIGSIVGFLHYGNIMENCSAENIVLTKTRLDGAPSIGVASGGWCYSATKTTTFKDNTFDNITMNGQSKEYAALNDLYGSAYYGESDVTNIILSNNVLTNITDNRTVVAP